ncbi:DNA translocase FtsK 4TM domain-containing protein [Anaerotignum lactatifermentans]|uniref:DNA translocase FtsK 4TM domain-containing protein n=2 Tax=Anaerotignum lactatifermentans TaxID=160404 RepID=A0ABS2GBY4_9FIRM|nr:DNA translocase FtsK 4TM domain-containing protein [Anaerotignum lactatifermentans]MBM6878215.1 DNA translocase FtsK 4TM domain-containing protein [Anaerotignum lactatifermentans]MBM6951295.1 DNA translocase FtsK 4TM domain-containing protein [Anaerotignum lactatifermentans]
MGIIGDLFGGFFKGILGVSGVLLPVLAVVYCVWMLVSEERRWPVVRFLGGLLFLLSVAGAAHLIHPVDVSAEAGFFGKCAAYFAGGSVSNGGLAGGVFGGGLFALLDTLGSVLVLMALILISLILMTGRSFFGAMGSLADHHKTRRQIKNEKIKNKADRIRQIEKIEAEREEKRAESRKKHGMSKEDFNIELDKNEKPETMPRVEETVFRKKKPEISVKKREPIYDFVKESEKPVSPVEETPAEDLFQEGLRVVPTPEKKEEPDVYEHIFGQTEEPAAATAPAAEFVPEPEDEEEIPVVMAAPAFEIEPVAEAEETPLSVETAEPETKEEETAEEKDTEETQEEIPAVADVPEEKPYVFPPLDLLGKDPGTGGAGGKAEMLENAKKLENTLRSFGVEAKVIQISKGPTVTRYELSPSQGVKVSKIVNLADDIALNLAASGIRIEAPIPGKAAVGIEVPNKETQSVYLRTVLESDAFKNHPSKLAFALGEDITGNPVVTDIAKMPHLLIAGATGSGKSVCINTLITSILYKADPKEVKLLLVDPKVVELSVYNGIPHLLIPVVTDPKKASAALNWAVREMLQRYNDFAACGVRDIKGFNAMKEEKGETEGKMSQIVIIIDELADLMMAAPGEVEDAICRLAQMARAAGMHLIIATQRPSVDVITGVIKANIPSRLAFAVSSGIDSRTILDMVGAEKLLGKGDMLFYPSGQAKPARMQGAFVTDKEVESIVDFLRKSSRPGYTQEMVEQITAVQKTAEGSDEELDEFYEQAVELIIEKEKASVSMLQRQFRIGYNRAARLMDELEKRGMVGPEDGSKPRKVLITRAQWDELRGVGENEE